MNRRRNSAAPKRWASTAILLQCVACPRRARREPPRRGPLSDGAAPLPLPSPAEPQVALPSPRVRFAVRDQSAWVERTSDATTSLFYAASAGFRRSNRSCSSGCSRPSGGALSQKPSRGTFRDSATGTAFRDNSAMLREPLFGTNLLRPAIERFRETRSTELTLAADTTTQTVYCGNGDAFFGNGVSA